MKHITSDQLDLLVDIESAASYLARHAVLHNWELPANHELKHLRDLIVALRHDATRINYEKGREH